MSCSDWLTLKKKYFFTLPHQSIFFLLYAVSPLFLPRFFWKTISISSFFLSLVLSCSDRFRCVLTLKEEYGFMFCQGPDPPTPAKNAISSFAGDETSGGRWSSTPMKDNPSTMIFPSRDLFFVLRTPLEILLMEEQNFRI